MAISFVNSVTTTSTSNSSSFTITKPTGVTINSGDFMIGVVAHFSSQSEEEQVSVTPPTGWTLIDDVFSFGTNSVQLSVMTRTAGSSEPGSWNGSFSGSQSIKVQMCAVYRGVTGFGDATSDTAGFDNSYSVGSVTNDSSNNWRILIAAYGSGSNSYVLESSEVRYAAWGSVDPGTAIEAAIFDSNGTVSIGNHSRTVSRDANWGTSAGWISTLVASSAEVPGTMSVTMPKVSVSLAGELGYSGSLAATMPKPSMTASGIASPPEGPLAIVVSPVVSVAGAHHASGSLSVVVLPVMEAVAETRAFGIRVITPEREVRVVRPRLGAVD